MLSFQELYTRVTNIMSDASATSVAIAKDLINDAYKEATTLCGIDDDGTFIITGVADQKEYRLPVDLRKLRTVQIIETDTSGSATSTSAGKLVDSAAAFTSSMIGKWVYNTTDNTFTKVTARDSATQLSVQDDIFASGEGYQLGDGNIYVSNEVVNESEWNFLNQTNVDVSSDVISDHFIRGRNIEIYPVQDSANNLIVLSYTKLVKDLSADDYTTGTVTVNKGSTTVTGSGTTFTAAMVGRYFKGSGQWYRIKSYTSATVITLEERFDETSLSGSTYTIGELPLIPETFHKHLPYYALSELYLRKEQVGLADRYENKWEKSRKEMMRFGSSKSEGLEVQLPVRERVFFDSSKDKLVTIS